jgi:hypothetical protein
MGWLELNTCTHRHTHYPPPPDYPVLIKQKFEEKKKTGTDSTAESKRILNSATQELKQLLKTYKK